MVAVVSLLTLDAQDDLDNPSSILVLLALTFSMVDATNAVVLGGNDDQALCTTSEAFYPLLRYQTFKPHHSTRVVIVTQTQPWRKASWILPYMKSTM